MDKATLDFWNEDNSGNKTVENVAELEASLRELHRQGPGIIGIDVPLFGNSLAVGVDVHYGFIMFGDKSGDPPYCMVIEDSDAPDEDFEFDVEGTPTPISLRRCIPFERVISLVKHYYSHGRFPEGTEWEED